MKSYLILSGALLLLTLNLFSQNANIRKGDRFFNELKYIEAVNEYHKAMSVSKETSFFYLTEQLAKSYLMLNDYENALTWHKKLMSFDKENKAENIKNYGLLLMNYEDYGLAKDIFKLYGEKQNSFEESEKLMKACQWAMENKDKSPIAKTVKTNIETGSRSMGFSFYDDGLIISIPQKKTYEEETTYYDLAQAKKTTNESFELPILLKGEINKSFYEASPILFNNGKEIYYSSNSSEVSKYKEKKAGKYEISKSGVNILKIYHAEKMDNEWKNIVELPFNSNEYSCTFPFITEDGLELYFCSDMPGGYGGFDIYKVTKQSNGLWDEPKNLGSAVNTAQNEIYPYVNAGNFYFSTKSGNGFGGYDIFVGILEQEEVRDIKNAGIPINSSKDDYSYIINKEGKFGYLSSNRENNRGYDYIYYFENLLGFDTLQGIVLNKLTNERVADISVNIKNKTNLDVLTDNNGAWKFPFQENDSQIEATFDSPWYETVTLSFSNIEESKENLKEVTLNPIMLYGKINDINNYENGSVKVKLLAKNEEGIWEVADIIVADEKGEWQFHIRKDKDYKVELSVKDELSDTEFVSRYDEPNDTRSETIERLRDFDLSLKGNNLNFDGYTVQIGAYRQPQNFKYDSLKKLHKVTQGNQGMNDDIERFTMGLFTDLAQAKKLRLEVITLGITDALIVAIKDGKRVFAIEMEE